MIKKTEVILKIEKKRFLQAFFRTWNRLEKKRVFCDFKDHFNLLVHQTTLKNIARILYDFCIFGILKKSHRFVKIRKRSGNTLKGVFWYGEIMSLQLNNICDDLKKATSQLSLEQNYPIIFFWTEFTFVNSKTTEKRRF